MQEIIKKTGGQLKHDQQKVKRKRENRKGKETSGVV